MKRLIATPEGAGQWSGHNTFEDANARFMRICGRDGA